jgi:hypothetical protein
MELQERMDLRGRSWVAILCLELLEQTVPMALMGVVEEVVVEEVGVSAMEATMWGVPEEEVVEAEEAVRVERVEQVVAALLLFSCLIMVLME